MIPELFQLINKKKLKQHRSRSMIPLHLASNIINRVSRVAQTTFSLTEHILTNTEKLVLGIINDAAAITRETEFLLSIALKRSEAFKSFIKSSPRLFHILTQLAKIIAAYRIHSLKERFMTKTAAEKALLEIHSRNAERIYNLCVESRGGLIKIAQFLSTNINMLPPVYVEYLSKLQDQVPPLPFNVIKHRVETELGQPLDRLFARFENTPIAAASLAQVHGAEMFDGSSVVVKVQTPDIENIVEIDLAAFQIVAGILNDFYPQFALTTISETLSDSVRMELDYYSELKNIVKFKTMLEKDQNMAIPTVYSELSSRRVLTMERFDGQRLIPYLENCDDEEQNHLLNIIVKSFTTQIITHGIFHADPHPGNFLVLEGSRIGLIDFGCIEQFSPEIFNAYIQMINAILTRNTEDVARLFGEMGFSTSNNDTKSLKIMAEEFIELLQIHPDRNLADADQFKELESGLSLLQKYPDVRVPRHFVLLGRVLLTLGGIMFHFRPDINLFEIMLNNFTSQ